MIIAGPNGIVNLNHGVDPKDQDELKAELEQLFTMIKQNGGKIAGFKILAEWEYSNKKDLNIIKKGDFPQKYSLFKHIMNNMGFPIKHLLGMNTKSKLYWEISNKE